MLQLINFARMAALSDYQEWHNSRWKFTSSQSTWHFDTTRPPLPGPDSYTHVCRFDADFRSSIESCKPNAQPSSWKSRNNLNKNIAAHGLYSASAEDQDLINAGADPNQEIFDRAEAHDVDIFQKINSWLGLEQSMIKFHNQRTGQMLHTHLDNFAARPERNNSFVVTDIDKSPDIIRRFAIMLDHWHLGQIFQLGNANFTQWQAGDCITWDWKNMPHSTANMGWWDRPMLQITGYVTEQTNTILQNSNKELVVKL